mmetsp:Transcript_9379/g.28235  ORF Transcript_9379/g.28235 Transcript_9379/m.28235 type:complete len:87 (-) Transcript_9379:2934-3194(-)
MSYGSEFRTVASLDPLLRHHPNWPHVCGNIKLILQCNATHLYEEEQRATLERGNRKLETSEEAKTIIKKLAKKDVELAYGLPLTTA